MNNFSITPTTLGEFLQEEIKARGTSQKEFADALGLRPSHLSEIIKGRRKIPNALLPQIASFLSIPVDALIENQSNLTIERKKEKALSPEEMEAERVLQEYDQVVSVKSLLKSIGATGMSLTARLNKLREAYSLPEPNLLSKSFAQLENRCFRRSAKTGRDPRMISTWVVKAQKTARDKNIDIPYDRTRNNELTEKLHVIFHRNVATVQSLRSVFSDFGFGFDIIDKEEHASVDGYSFFMDGHPFIIVTNRFQRIDNLAFTVLHELGHVVLGHTNANESMIAVDERLMDYDEESSELDKEVQADNFATEALIPKKVWCLTPRVPLNPFVIQKVFTNWAHERELNEWIVLGRVSHETGMYKFKSNVNRNVH